MEEIRLNKYLSEMGLCSRREADRLIESGKVMVDGAPAVMGMKIREGQAVVLNGKPVAGTFGPKPVLLAVNKPKGVVCTTSDKDRALNIVEMVGYPERVYPVGRLDKDSEGLIFLTNQGDLVNRIMRGANGHEKEYVVQVNKPVTEEFVKTMETGIWLKELNVTTKPCRITVTGKQEFHIILTQGLNRQIRRMCDTCGYSVRSLVRIRIMNVHLGNLKTGTFRKVTRREYETLTEMLENGRNFNS
ncbi:MAG: pseudouridine synthase [Hungatella sp.]|jgi:23S rRNA pseudouridine2604 synthase|nr:pseudouridine synthase [Hungatella sp.]